MNDLLDVKVLGNSVLRQKAKNIEEITPEILKLAKEMLDTMYDAPGVGLAAPQVGHSIRLIVLDADFRGEEDEDGELKRNPIIAINPVITFIPDCDQVEEEEGCLSVPDIYARVSRPDVINIEYTNEKGEKIVHENLSGYITRIFQHEIDHLNGVLFIDKMHPSDRIMNESKLKKMARKNKS